MLCLCLGLIVLIQSLSPKREQPVQELLFSDIMKENGFYLIKKNSKPFTGVIVEYYTDGTLKSRTEIKEGLLHGMSEGRHANGALQVREFFENGIADGCKTLWNDQGQKLSQASIVDGKYEDVFLAWHENGVLAQRIEMRSGEPHGMASAWDPNGELIAQVEMDQGRELRRIPIGEGNPLKDLAQIE